MRLLPRSAVDTAATRLAGVVRRTPVLTVNLPGGLDEVVLKLELLQLSGSFKARGAANTLLAARDDGTLPAAGVIAASGGNAGLGVVHAARMLDVPAEIFVPRAASPVKVDRLRALGATVTVTGAYFADALAASEKRAAETGALTVHAYDQDSVAAGQGTLAVELVEQVPQLDTVLVAVGGGGLIAGVLAGLDRRARVVAVEPERIPTLHAALEAGRPVDVEVGGVAADSLGARRASRLAHDMAVEHRVHSVLVSEEAILDARRWLWASCRLAAETGGATATAALLSGAYRPAPGERVVAIVCGGNTDPADLSRPPAPPAP